MIRGYVTLLERVFLVEILPPWHSNRLSPLVKPPKLHLSDCGLTCTLLGMDAASLAANRPLLGQLLETFAFDELRRLASDLGSLGLRHRYRHARNPQDEAGSECRDVLSVRLSPRL